MSAGNNEVGKSLVPLQKQLSAQLHAPESILADGTLKKLQNLPRSHYLSLPVTTCHHLSLPVTTCHYLLPPVTTCPQWVKYKMKYRHLFMFCMYYMYNRDRLHCTALYCTYNVTLRRVRTTVVVGEQWVTYCVCVCVCVCVCSLSYPACNAHAPYCRLWPAPLHKIFPHYLINGRIFGKSCWTQNGCFDFSLQLLFQTFLTVRRTERDMIKKMHFGVHVKYRLLFSDFNETWIFSTDCRKKPQISNLIKIRPVGAELFHADGRIDRLGEANTRF